MSASLPFPAVGGQLHLDLWPVESFSYSVTMTLSYSAQAAVTKYPDRVA